jgi:hypothetical protein
VPTEQFANNAPTNQVTTGYSATATVLAMFSISGYPTSPQYRLLNPRTGEVLLVTGIAGSTLTVTRGAEGTTAQPILATDLLTHILTAGALYNIGLSWRVIRGPVTPMMCGFSWWNGYTGAFGPGNRYWFFDGRAGMPNITADAQWPERSLVSSAAAGLAYIGRFDTGTASGTYTFGITVDDGGLAYYTPSTASTTPPTTTNILNNNWGSTQGATYRSATATLAANTTYRVDYYFGNNAGGYQFTGYLDRPTTSNNFLLNFDATALGGTRMYPGYIFVDRMPFRSILNVIQGGVIIASKTHDAALDPVGTIAIDPNNRVGTTVTLQVTDASGGILTSYDTPIYGGEVFSL